MMELLHFINVALHQRLFNHLDLTLTCCETDLQPGLTSLNGGEVTWHGKIQRGCKQIPESGATDKLLEDLFDPKHQ